MSMSKKHWGIVGGGVLGMQLANRLSRQGCRVTILEAGQSLGGLAGVWNLGDLTWDKFYHVILLSDTTLRGLLEEIGLGGELRWVETKTGFLTDRKLYSMSNSIEFLKFPPLSLLDKVRLGATIFYASRVKNWRRLEGIPVAGWLRRLSGNNTFEKIWLPLLRAKLGENYRHTSAAFIWATIQRMYSARRTGLKKELFGYVEGGYARILDAFTSRLIAQGVRIETNFAASKVYSSEDGGVVVENQNGETFTFDEVILTVPSSIAAGICEVLSVEEVEKHRQVEYLGVICASVLLKKSISPYYVTNITDDSPFTGVIEMTNIVDPSFFKGRSLVYLPKYVKKSDPIFRLSDDEIGERFRESLLEMYDHIGEEDVISVQVARAPNVFALSTLNYSEKLPNVATSIPGVYILNSAHIVNGVLNVNETLQVVDRELPAILGIASKPKTIKRQKV
jgi:protoporphyrinogen oxidase